MITSYLKILRLSYLFFFSSYSCQYGSNICGFSIIVYLHAGAYFKKNKNKKMREYELCYFVFVIGETTCDFDTFFLDVLRKCQQFLAPSSNCHFKRQLYVALLCIVAQHQQQCLLCHVSQENELKPPTHQISCFNFVSQFINFLHFVAPNFLHAIDVRISR